MARYYFRKGEDDYCYQLASHYDYMKENELKELILFEAEIDVGSGMFYCNKFLESGNSNDGTCGKMCNEYKPRNGKNGLCKHWRNGYSITDKIKIIKIK